MDPNKQVPEDQINFRAWRIRVRKHWIRLLVFPLLAACLAAGISFWLPNTYRATTTILPLTESESPGGLRQLTEFVASFGSAEMSPSSATRATFLAILGSKTLAESVIQKEQLLPILFPSKWDAQANRWRSDKGNVPPSIHYGAERIFRRHVQIDQPKALPTIRIRTTFRDPDVAARVANSFVEELENFVDRKALHLSTRNRRFIEKQLAEVKVQILESEKNLARFYDRNPVSSRSNTVNVPVGGDTKGKKGEVVILPDVPQKAYYEYLQMERNVLANTVNLVASQLEMAKIEESKDELRFQVIDEAYPPFRKFGPKRTVMVVTAFLFMLIATFLGLVVLGKDELSVGA